MEAIEVWNQLVTPRMAAVPWGETLRRWTKHGVKLSGHKCWSV